MTPLEKFTPGPWTWIDTSVRGDPLTGPNKDCLVGPPRDPECKPYATDSSEHVLYFDIPIENEANANLIAAAPDMYAIVGEFLALRQAVIDVGGTKGPLDQQMIEKFAEMQCGVVDRAEAVLRKARGEK